MNSKQLEILNRNLKIKVDELENKSDRTLFFGKINMLSETVYYHFYMKGEMFFLTIYTNPNKEYTEPWLKPFKYRDEITTDMFYVHDFLVYPECCDYEFCLLLKSKGIRLNYLELDDERPNKKFYGVLYDELKKVKKQ